MRSNRTIRMLGTGLFGAVAIVVAVASLAFACSALPHATSGYITLTPNVGASSTSSGAQTNFLVNGWCHPTELFCYTPTVVPNETQSVAGTMRFAKCSSNVQECTGVIVEPGNIPGDIDNSVHEFHNTLCTNTSPALPANNNGLLAPTTNSVIISNRTNTVATVTGQAAMPGDPNANSVADDTGVYVVCADILNGGGTSATHKVLWNFFTLV